MEKLERISFGIDVATASYKALSECNGWNNKEGQNITELQLLGIISHYGTVSQLLCYVFLLKFKIKYFIEIIFSICHLGQLKYPSYLHVCVCEMINLKRSKLFSVLPCFNAVYIFKIRMSKRCIKHTK